MHAASFSVATEKIFLFNYQSGTTTPSIRNANRRGGGTRLRNYLLLTSLPLRFGNTAQYNFSIGLSESIVIGCHFGTVYLSILEGVPIKLIMCGRKQKCMIIMQVALVNIYTHLIVP